MEIIGLAYCFDFPFTAYLLIPDYQGLLLTCPFATEVVTTGVLKLMWLYPVYSKKLEPSAWNDLELI